MQESMAFTYLSSTPTGGTDTAPVALKGEKTKSTDSLWSPPIYSCCEFRLTPPLLLKISGFIIYCLQPRRGLFHCGWIQSFIGSAATGPVNDASPAGDSESTSLTFSQFTATAAERNNTPITKWNHSGDSVWTTRWIITARCHCCWCVPQKAHTIQGLVQQRKK